jgi:hypothetical protein
LVKSETERPGTAFPTTPKNNRKSFGSLRFAPVAQDDNVEVKAGQSRCRAGMKF